MALVVCLLGLKFTMFFKIFAGVAKVAMSDADESRLVVGLIDENGERLELAQPVLTEMYLDAWLSNLLNSMRLTVACSLVETLSADTDIPVSSVQVAVLSMNVKFGQHLRSCFGMQQPDLAMAALRVEINQLWERTANALDSSSLSLLSRKMAVTRLMTMQQHLHVLELLSRAPVLESSFEWQAQLRYSMEDGHDPDETLLNPRPKAAPPPTNTAKARRSSYMAAPAVVTSPFPLPGVACIVRIGNVGLEYGYEYIGSADRLVLTPPTVRHHRFALRPMCACVAAELL